MTWYAVIDGAHNLISVGETVADAGTLAAKGYTAIPLPSNPTGQIWNPTTLTFSQPVVWNSYDTADWVGRFTPAEVAAVRGSADLDVQAFLYRLQFAPSVQPQSPIIQQGLAVLVQLGLLTADRAAIIGAN